MSVLGKRRRLNEPVVARAMTTKRPIDKELKVVSQATLAGSQVSTTLKTTTFPCTIVGLRWELNFAQDGGSGLAQYSWAIVITKDGNSPNTISLSNAADMYTPEQNVLAFGVGQIDNNTETKQVSGNTKTMRKLRQGDVVHFIAIGVATNTVSIQGVIQFFCKS